MRSIAIYKPFLRIDLILSIGMTDPDGRQNLHNWAGDVWIKPLSDGSFAAALINRDPQHAHPLRVGFGAGDTMLFPAGPFGKMLVRDVHARQVSCVICVTLFWFCFKSFRTWACSRCRWRWR